MQMCVSVRTPSWFSSRRLLEQKLADLHKCSNIHQVKQLHAQIFKADLHHDLYVAPKLVSAFSLCRQMVLAVKVFSQVPEPNVQLYNTLIRAHVQNSQTSQAFATFFEMQVSDLYPDNFTYPFLLKGCSGESWFSVIEMVHTHIEKFGFSWDVFVPNSLIDCYSKCGSRGTAAAKKVFMVMNERDIVSWNSIVNGLVRAGESKEARQMFDTMPERDTVSWNTMLDGHVKAGEMNEAFQLFEEMPERNVVSWSTMIWGYCKFGDMDMAKMLFYKMPIKNLVTWTIIISGYAEKGMAKEATGLYDQMVEARLKLDDGAAISILAACAESGLLRLGEKVHSSIKKSRFKVSTEVSNALIDMYSKCGCLDTAQTIFNEIPKKDFISWNSMLHGLAMHGHGVEALSLFSQMRIEGFNPDKVTLVSVLCACTHAGLVEEGLRYFHSMEQDYGIVPLPEHYGCMLDLLGRKGHLKEAIKLLNNMPVKPNAVIWGTLLGACRMHNNAELAREILDHLAESELSDPGNMSVISNIYAAVQDWGNVAETRMKMKSVGIQKPSGASSIEIGDEVHEFTVLDRSHPQSDQIYRIIEELDRDLKPVRSMELELKINQ